MSGQKQEPSGLITIVIAGVLLFIACSMLWYFFQGPLLQGLRWLRVVEIFPLSIFTHGHNYCLSWLTEVRFKDPAPSNHIVGLAQGCFGQSYLSSLPPDQQTQYYSLTATSLQGIERMATTYYKWPFALLFIGLGVYIVFFSPRNQFRTKHNLETFIRAQVKMWPVISPIVDFNPIHSSARVVGSLVPDKLPLFAEALSPEEWISWHRIPVVNNIADRETTRRALLLQLGPRWNNSFDGLPIYVRALFAAFALKGVQKRDDSDDLLGKLSTCWTPKGGFALTAALAGEVNRILADPAIGGEALKIAQPHAYRVTALLAVLRWARMLGGVLAPAQFLWVRGADRDLWYALNNLGRRSFHAEGAGALAHFMAEQLAKKPLPIPRIDTALITLNQYLAGSPLPIPPREGDDTTPGTSRDIVKGNA